jgi:uncharacterized protein (DUF1501 family)
MTTSPNTRAAGVQRPIVGHPDGITRRGFIGTAAATAGLATVVPAWFADRAGAATPVASTDGILVVITLGGGNDGLNTVVPRGGANRGTYEQLRGAVAIPAGELLPLDPAGAYGLHPSLTGLTQRYAAGKVAIVQGTGVTSALDLSHFTSMATVMAGTSTAARTSGWLGRFLDGVSEWETGLRGVALGASVPLHLVGTRAKVTAVPADGAVWGADTSARWERQAFDAVRAMAAKPTGLGVWPDKVATVSRDAVEQAKFVGQVLTPPPTVPGLPADLTIAARLLNLNLGVRVLSASFGSFDTHAGQLQGHAALLKHLDDGIEAFYATLRPELAPQVAFVVVSEFGRRASANASSGTDHGAASHTLVIGDRVKGGLHAAYPSLTTLDSSGSLVPSVDFRSVYRTVLDQWMRADGAGLVGSSFTPLDLFKPIAP